MGRHIPADVSQVIGYHAGQEVLEGKFGGGRSEERRLNEQRANIKGKRISERSREEPKKIRSKKFIFSSCS